MRTIHDLPDVTGIPVLVRASLNVPVANGVVVNTFRLRAALPTINFLQKRGARVILIGHIGDAGTETLLPVFEALRTMVSGLRFCPVSTGKEARAAVRNLIPGEVLMLENVRRHTGEKHNDGALAKELAMLADIFVMDAFDVCHRSHASVVGIPEYLPTYAGLQVAREVQELSKALTPTAPSLAILGGAKFSTKEPVLTKLLERYDRVFVGGALANDFMRASGHSVGASLVSRDTDQLAINTILKNQKLMLPLDEVVAEPNATHTAADAVVDVARVPSNKAILDDGPRTIAALATRVATAKTILWNGPLGLYERGFTDGTESLARVIAASDAYTILGGGDTIAAVETLGLGHRFSFISTGGGAMLDFLAHGTLPGLEKIP